MSTTEIVSAGERAVLERVRSQLARIQDGDVRAIGIRTAGRPVWQGARETVIESRRVRIAACPSVLAVLETLADAPADAVTVLLTDVAESELGDAILARLHRGKLLDADRYTLLGDKLGARGLDPRILTEPWLVDALITLATADALPPTTGATISRQRAVGLVAAARLDVDPEQVELIDLVATFDNTAVRERWRSLSDAERAGLAGHLRERHGPGAAVVATLAQARDDVLAELLVAHAVTAVAPTSDSSAAIALGGFTQSRFVAPRPAAPELRAAAVAAAVHARRTSSARVDQQIRRAGALLDELDATGVAAYSTVLPGGFTERLAAAAVALDEVTLAACEEHREADLQPHRIARLRAAARLRRWLDTRPAAEFATAAQALDHHARELAWVDRALAQVRAGDAEPRVGAVLGDVAERAGSVRSRFDTAFAARLAVARDTPTDALAVETVLPAVVAPLAQGVGVLLVVVDGMSGAVAGDLADRLIDGRAGWTEIVRSAGEGREAILAALPTETRYSRSSLFRAALGTGGQSQERAAFAGHRFWPAGGAVLVHKAGVGGRDGGDLGPELEAALSSTPVPPVVAVVLNAVDDSLAKGRQSADPAWRPEDIPGLPQLLERAATTERIVVLTSDHGHVLEHGSQARDHPGGGARWRPDSAAVAPDEVLVTGPRVLAPDGRAVLAATEDLRYGARAHGYHGGATLAEAAIPLLVLLPPGVGVPAGWRECPPPAPPWWTGAPPPAVPVEQPARRAAKKPVTPREHGLFDLPDSGRLAPSRGSTLVASPAFRAAYAEMPANRVPDPAVFAAVVDALVAAGGRLPVGGVLSAAGRAGRNPRGLVTAMGRVLNRDSYPVLVLVDGGRAVALDRGLLDEQFPPKRS